MISIDDHVIEPPHLWQSRLPKKYLADGPQFLEIEGSFVDPADHPQVGVRNVWHYEGRQYLNFALNAVAGKPFSEFGVEPQRWEEIRPGCYDPTARAADMDLDGIQAGQARQTPRVHHRGEGFAGRGAGQFRRPLVRGIVARSTRSDSRARDARRLRPEGGCVGLRCG